MHYFLAPLKGLILFQKFIETSFSCSTKAQDCIFFRSAKLRQHRHRHRQAIAPPSNFLHYKTKDFKTWNSIESRFVPEKSELDIYFDDELMELDEEHSEDFDVLLYRKLNEKKFPILSIMARAVLSIPITTVASESSFSIGGRVLTKYISSTLPEHIQMLICTWSWLYGFSENMNDEEDINTKDECNTEMTMTQHRFGLQD
ncbi:zinc finger BED domain-containing protein RICESLEEPER 2-like [Vicia villosa]|uniref:zinc finger BED domain-containing protein RICESLEEPER 2-like n=1 Tax=Vicia villosa TaxID=3911 RepID=UPI00273CBAFD|nr:zinc finger BED domain-containing protein RICESLEEPER 2-like [Vicia villosa]